MTKQELDRLAELNDVLASTTGKEFEFAYMEYRELTLKQAREYRERNESEITQYFKDKIEGKKFDEVDANVWSFYSDWHKDVFGYRPRSMSINERGV